MSDIDPSELATIASLARSGDIRREDAPVILRMVSEIERLRKIEAAAREYLEASEEYIQWDDPPMAVCNRRSDAFTALDRALAEGGGK